MLKRILLIGTVICVAAFAYTQRSLIRDAVYPPTRTASIPPAMTYQEIATDRATSTADTAVDTDRIPSEPDQATKVDTLEDPVVSDANDSLNLKVPFQPQAPFADWAMPYKEACEEASLIMVDHYLRGVPLSAQEMKDQIDEQVAWQKTNFGGHFDTSIDQTAELAHAFYPYTTEVISPLTPERIRTEIAKGNPVIVPSAGQELGNPYFRQPGPLYHMLVIKGYIGDHSFITNDPGTKRGADYVYDADVLMSAIRDWTGKAPDGKVVGLILHQ